MANIPIGEHGDSAGHVGLGRLGRGDRCADIAVATWSTEWNYGPRWEDTFLAAYGVSPDEDRTHYYRNLWNLTNPIRRRLRSRSLGATELEGGDRIHR